MLDLRINKSGVDIWHKRGDVIDRPYGSGDFVFIKFLTPMLVHTRDGLRRVAAGSCIIYAPPFKQWYEGDGCGFGNDWFHFEGKDALPLLKQRRLPLNEPFLPADTGFVSGLIGAIYAECIKRQAHWEEAASLCVESFFLKLSREMPDARADAATPRKRELLRRFQSVRAMVLSDICHKWKVTEMAAEAHLSAARFAVLYKEFFRVSPLEELLEARLAHARWLLTNESLLVREAASQSGFKNIHYFCRVFKRREGCSPGDYQPRRSR